ncbi:hypothetical protein DPMN_072795 [Dreissena polymorpha]|uniref:Uncharacterized protein n=1 Tax=Dreissena polymorpha TaxID=45954 RepID=A0A9D4BXX6_DREPO|nr:hypothetical protein DPMN_072795 [Dreissena polymorpha]
MEVGKTKFKCRPHTKVILIELLKFESSAAVVQGTSLRAQNNEFVQYIADNWRQVKEARIERDKKDGNTLEKFLNERNPFSEESHLRNIETGVIADKFVNADIANEVGQNVLKAMKDQKISDIIETAVNYALNVPTVVVVKTLPPTQAAGQYHSFRVNHQVQTNGLDMNQTL